MSTPSMAITTTWSPVGTTVIDGVASAAVARGAVVTSSDSAPTSARALMGTSARQEDSGDPGGSDFANPERTSVAITVTVTLCPIRTLMATAIASTRT